MGLSEEQKRELVEFVQKNYEVLNGKQNNVKSNKQAQILYEGITEELDNMQGVKKGHWTKWRDVSALKKYITL